MLKWFIREKNNKLGELAYYGPFEETELSARLNDRFADFMASGGANIDAVQLAESEWTNMCINPAKFWYDWLAEDDELEMIDAVIARMNAETPAPPVQLTLPSYDHIGRGSYIEA